MERGILALQVTSLLADLELLSRLESVDVEERQYSLALLKHYTQVRRLSRTLSLGGRRGMDKWGKLEQTSCKFCRRNLRVMLSSRSERAATTFSMTSAGDTKI